MTQRCFGLATALLLIGALGGCERPGLPVLRPLQQPAGDAGAATPRVNADVGTTQATPPPEIAYGTPAEVTLPPGPPPGQGGDVSLDFADTDIREVVAQILGTMLKVNYTIDPAVHGTATLRTAAPMARAQLLPTLQALLSQDGATLVQSGSLYRVVPSAAAAGAPSLAASASAAGGTVIALRYASAEDLAKVLQPFVATGGKIAAEPAGNALVVSGEPGTRETLVSLVRAFDIDTLAGQSYALLPVTAGSAKDFASALQDAFRSQGGGALAGLVRVVPMERINAVLIVASQPRYLDDARRVYGLIERQRRSTVRSWHVYYLQNSRSNDIAYVLQQAFTPKNVTAQPSNTGAGTTAPGGSRQLNGSGGGIGGGSSGIGTGGIGAGGGAGIGGASGIGMGGGIGSGGGIGTGTGGIGTQGGIGGQGGLGGTNGALGGQSQAAGGAGQAAGANPLLGPLEEGGTNAEAETDAMRIVPNAQNNAILVYGTQQEEDTIEAMLRKIDILPLQVRIDATIAEVTLNDQLQYGTQFFFKSGGINGVLSFANAAVSTLPLASLATNFPGFVLGGNNNGGAPFAISALQAVTTVHVLSSPELLVLDNQPARLQVGDLVPFLTESSQSTLTANAPVVNSIDYRETGVIMAVTPRVNSGGLITLDIAQEVSDIDTSAPTTSGINSPTFLERNVQTRVVVQDGQTVGLAGLIRDSVSRSNQGIPWLKDIPLIGLLAGGQNNTRTRTELLVLLTPHVEHDQRDARALTEDLRDQLINAAAVPDEVQTLAPSGSPDPGRRLRRGLGLEQ
ncbi:MAG: type II secretion system secretin GspD [Acidisphaera sp.]|nr:type II secretion system secretin GspD [Acidisphaera sp.]